MEIRHADLQIEVEEAQDLLRGAFPVIGLRHSGCCSSAEGRWRCCVRFMYMNRLACLPSI